MQTTKLPYELLIRYDLTGKPSGAHVQHRFVTTDDVGAPLGEFPGPAEALTLDTAAGFPLGDLLTQAQTDALIAVATANAERDVAVAHAAELEAQLAALRTAQG
jgi:hypothetical protein